MTLLHHGRVLNVMIAPKTAYKNRSFLAYPALDLRAVLESDRVHLLAISVFCRLHQTTLRLTEKRAAPKAAFVVYQSAGVFGHSVNRNDA